MIIFFQPFLAFFWTECSRHSGRFWTEIIMDMPLSNFVYIKESSLAFLAFFDLFWPFSVMALVQHQLGP